MARVKADESTMPIEQRFLRELRLEQIIENLPTIMSYVGSTQTEIEKTMRLVTLLLNAHPAVDIPAAIDMQKYQP